MSYTTLSTRILSAFLSLLLVMSLYSPFLNHELAKIHPALDVPRAFAAPASEATQVAQLAQDAEKGLVDFGNFIKNTINEASNFLTAQGTITILGKEFGLDTVAWIIAKAVIRSMTASIVNWINSGFEGSPAFVTDLEGFLLDVADRVVEDALKDSKIEFLCSPFRLDVRVAVAVQYRQGQTSEAQCTISGIVNNVENFLAGSFNEGGFTGWFELTAQPQNTEVGALLRTNAHITARIVDAQGREVAKLDFGDGFFSKSICEVVAGDEECFISTPGKVIESQLNHVLGSGVRTAELADELGESVEAIFGALVGQAITGARGLFGLSSSGFQGTAGSYLDALVAEASSEPFDFVNSQFTTAIRNERDFINLHLGVIDEIENIAVENEVAREQSRIIDEDGDEIACYALSVPQSINRLADQFTDIVPLGEAAIIVVEDIQARFNTATSAAVKGDLINDFSSLQNGQPTLDLDDTEFQFLTNLLEQYTAIETTDNVRASIIAILREQNLVGGLHNEIELSRAEVTTIRDTKIKLDDFREDIAAEVARCSALRQEILNNNSNSGGDR